MSFTTTGTSYPSDNYINLTLLVKVVVDYWFSYVKNSSTKMNWLILVRNALEIRIVEFLSF